MSAELAAPPSAPDYRICIPIIGLALEGEAIDDIDRKIKSLYLEGQITRSSLFFNNPRVTGLLRNNGPQTIELRRKNRIAEAIKFCELRNSFYNQGQIRTIFMVSLCVACYFAGFFPIIAAVLGAWSLYSATVTHFSSIPNTSEAIVALKEENEITLSIMWKLDIDIGK